MVTKIYVLVDAPFKAFHCSEINPFFFFLFFKDAHLILYNFRIYKQILNWFPWTLSGLEQQSQRWKSCN